MDTSYSDYIDMLYASASAISHVQPTRYHSTVADFQKARSVQTIDLTPNASISLCSARTEEDTPPSSASML